jgi:hypothetical protein
LAGLEFSVKVVRHKRENAACGKKPTADPQSLSQNPHPNVAKNATLGWGTRFSTEPDSCPDSKKIKIPTQPKVGLEWGTKFHPLDQSPVLASKLFFPVVNLLPCIPE